MIHPTASPLVSGLPAPTVASPYVPPAACEEAVLCADGVTLSGSGCPPAPVSMDATAAAEKGTLNVGLGGLVVAAAMAGLAVAGSLAPSLGSMVPATSVSQSQGQFQQDPKTLVTNLATCAESSARALPQVNKVHDQWKADAAGMKATVDGVGGHVDAMIRAPKGKDLALHQKAVDEGLVRLGSQLKDFQGRLAQESPVVDEFLAKNRDTLTEVGTVTWTLKGSVDSAAHGAGIFSPQRRALHDLSGALGSASRNVAMATERTTTSRQEDQTLQQNVETLQKFVAEVQKSVEKARTDPKAMAKVEEGVRTLQKAVTLSGQLIGQSEKDVSEASAFSHRGAQDLDGALQKLQAWTGGSPGPSTSRP